MSRPRSHNPRRDRRAGFSLVEMLIALTISATLLTATLAALRSSFQHYKSTTESASTHVVSRIMMHRLLTMIRTGDEFGPYPDDPLDPLQNPVTGAQFIEFVSQRDLDGGVNRVTRIEFRDGDEGESGEIWYVLIEPGDPAVILEERPLLSGVRQAAFTLDFNRQTWRLDRATIDMTVEPNDSRDLTIGGDATPETIRLVASAVPRQFH
ncbi:MAG: prepilin-type N-terminal cleavage/methylation domain-containing protein [Planctomycetota bacterium]|nr:prepilin-type N-terminal cleavage/methylation domain-containing protein [Planctomycetota bacterium]